MKPMRRVLWLLILVTPLVIGQPGAIAVEVGQKAPDFELDSTKGGKLKLSDLKGKNVLINFYGRDYDPT
jgi:cytochrome oxidase Cu insertion factor (SCO1/SenC/PrrC family)